MPSIDNPIWGVIGVFATVIFGIFGIIGVILALLPLLHSKKGLSYEFLSITPILQIARGFKEKIEIKLSGQIVKDVNLVNIRFTSTGGLPIKPDDYAKPIKLIVINGRIVGADIINTEPKDLGELIESHDTTSVTIKKVLLNSKDKFDLQILISEFSGKPNDIQIDGRIAGVKAIKESKDRQIMEMLFTSTVPEASILLPIIIPIASSFLATVGSMFLRDVLDKQIRKNK
jgi:hypothetical protein